MGCLSLTWSYQLLCLQFLLFYSLASATLCSREQSSALLHFKQLFSFNNYSSYDCYYANVPSHPKMMYWKESSDCCSWDGVTCDTVTGHVIGLDLSCSWLYGNIPSNTSLFLLRHLQSLNLAFNDFYLSQISSYFSLLPSLRLLNLSNSNFEGQIPMEISRLSKLISLDLSSYYLTLETPVLEGLVQNLTQLRELTLDSVNLSTIVPSSFLNLSSSLTSLSLRECGMQGNFPERIFSLPNLKSLYLRGSNNLTINFPKFNWSSPLEHLDVSYMNFSRGFPNSISNLKSLRYLILSNCMLFGPILASLGNLTQLTHLDLSSNRFNSTMPDTFVNLKKLPFLDVTNNQLVGPIPASLGNLTQLTYLDLSSNSFNSTIPDTFVNLKQLSSFYLASNQLIGPVPSLLSELENLVDISLYNNSFIGTIPSSLYTLPLLKYIDLGYNQLTGHIGEFQSNSLESICLDGNRLHGSIPSSIFELVNLTTLLLSSNNLSGSLELSMFTNFNHSNLLQGPIPNPLPYLEYLLLSNNKLTGSIPHLICNLSTLRITDLSNNSLTGNIPKCLGKISNSLVVLDLQKNRFYGTIPEIFAKCNFLKTLNLNNNGLEGHVPRSLVNCAMLEVLDIGNNNINDTFPFWLGNLPELRILVLRFNNFYGFVQNFSEASSKSFSQLRVFDLSNNNFNGSLPIRYFENMKAMMNIDEIERTLQYMSPDTPDYYDSITVTVKGFDIKLEKIITIFTSIDLSNNNFHGEIPEIIGKLHALRVLNFSQNNLTNCIPSSLGNLVNLESLDLSYNKFVGEIPSEMTRLNFLQILNLSKNQLTGAIPRDNHFDTFSNTSYIGNLGLCGFPLTKKCGIDDTQQPLLKLEDEAKSTNGFGWKIVLVGYGCGVAIGGITGCIVLWTGKPKWVADLVAYWILRIVEREHPRKGIKLYKKRGGR